MINQNKLEEIVILKYLKKNLMEMPKNTGYYSTSNLINDIRRQFLNELINKIKIQPPDQP